MPTERDKRNIADFVEKTLNVDPLVVRSCLQTEILGEWQAVLEPLNEFDEHLYIMTYGGGDEAHIDTYNRIAHHKVIQRLPR